MGHKTILHGYIACVFGLEYARLNGAGLASLPEWSAETNNPLVSRDMFAQPHNGYLGPIIAFGRSYSGVEGHWQRWREEFESLLRTLYWDEAHVWVETELWGDFHCSWSKRVPDPDEEEPAEERSAHAPGDTSQDEQLGPTTNWLYRGPERNVVR